MCWSAEVSLKTYLFGMILAVITKLKTKIDTPLWIFLVLFTHMQLVEYFLWKNIDDPKKLEFWSKIGAVLIVAQPLFLINMMKDGLVKTQLLAFWTVFVLGWFLLKTNKFETKIGKNGHLVWNWFPEGAWGLVWVAAWFAPVILSKNYQFLALSLAGFLPSLYFYMKHNTWGSMWCWISVMSWLFYFQN
jgi:hypothetical protein